MCEMAYKGNVSSCAPVFAKNGSLSTEGSLVKSSANVREHRRHAYSYPGVDVSWKKRYQLLVESYKTSNIVFRKRAINVHTKRFVNFRTLLHNAYVRRNLCDDDVVAMTSSKPCNVSDVVIHQWSQYSEKRKLMLLKFHGSTRTKKPALTFRIVAFVVRFCISQVKRHSLRTQEDDELSPFIKQVHFHEQHSAADVELMFDPTLFKAKRQSRMSEEIIRIWSKPPDLRTEQELYTVQIGARNMPSFKEFPARMQRLIAEVGIYSKYEAKRVLVRQGNPAEHFYFLLSGSVVVMVMDDERKYARPVAYLYKGQTFGELAIINRTSRQSTVIAKETCELLKISVSDYHRIFMAGGVRNIQDPDYKDFIGHLSFLQDWPVEKLQEQPTKCLFLYFKRGDVLVKDSHYSDWVIVVKSGSVSVLKKLKKVIAYKWKTEREIQLEYEKEIQTRRRTQLKSLQILPDLHISLRSKIDKIKRTDAGNLKLPQHSKPKILKDKVHQQEGVEICKLSKPTKNNQGSCSYTLNLSNPVDEHHGSLSYKYGKPMDEHHGSLSYKYGKPMDEHHGSLSVNLPPIHVDAARCTDSQSRCNLPPLYSPRTKHTGGGGKGGRGGLGGGGLGGGGGGGVFKKKSFNYMSRNRLNQIDESSGKDGSVFERVNTKHGRRRESDLEREKEMMGFKQHVRTISEDLDAGIKRKDIDEVTPADLNPEFVKIQTLTKGQVFGLADVILGEQTSFCVISNGADCFLINKQFYKEHLSEKLFRKMRHELCPYPTEEELQDKLQLSIDWDAYRGRTLQSALHHVRLRKQITLLT